MPQAKIDLVTQDHKADEFTLILVEDGPWPDEDANWSECLSRIQTRIYDAIDVAVDGHLAAKYPDSKGKKVRIQIDSPHGAPRRLLELISKFREYQSNPINDYHLAVRRSKYISQLWITTGDERNVSSTTTPGTNKPSD